MKIDIAFEHAAEYAVGFLPFMQKYIENETLSNNLTLENYVNINDLLVTPTAQANAYIYNKE